MPLGPACPDCGKLVPFVRTQWNIGRVFACARCETPLIIRKSTSAFLGLGLFTVFWLSRPHFPAEWGGQFGLFGLILLIGAPLTWFLTRIRRAEHQPPR